MAAKRVFSVIVFMILSKLKEVQSDEVWQKEQFPNPARDIEACSRRGKVSWICDPDNILSYETANKVEELLFSVRKNTVSGCSTRSENPGFQIGVAVMKKMHGVPDESIAVTAENFAKHLHDRWGVGNAGCDDGAVLLLSITDRQIYVSTGRGAKEKLTNDQIDVLIEEIKPYLKKQKYDQSVELAVVRMGEVFSGKVLKQPISVIFLGSLLLGCTLHSRVKMSVMIAPQNWKGSKRSETELSIPRNLMQASPAPFAWKNSSPRSKPDC